MGRGFDGEGYSIYGYKRFLLTPSPFYGNIFISLPIVQEFNPIVNNPNENEAGMINYI